jgi:hypothetical protein
VPEAIAEGVSNPQNKISNSLVGFDTTENTVTKPTVASKTQCY